MSFIWEVWINIVFDDYFITKLGPVINDEYQYAIVTDSLKLSLYVLARNINYFFDNYDDEVINFLSNTCSSDKTIEYLTSPIMINNDC